MRSFILSDLSKVEAFNFRSGNFNQKGRDEVLQDACRGDRPVAPTLLGRTATANGSRTNGPDPRQRPQSGIPPLCGPRPLKKNLQDVTLIIFTDSEGCRIFLAVGKVYESLKIDEGI
jgi:hypothetical protein